MKRPPIKLTLRHMTPRDIFRRLFVSWLTAVFFCLIFVPSDKWGLGNLSSLAALSFSGTLVTAAIAFVFYSLLSLLADTAPLERWAMFAAFTATALIYNTVTYSTLFLCAALAIITALLFYALHGRYTVSDIPPRRLKAAVFILTVLFALLFAADGIIRIFNLHIATYDFGIFAQMFSSMKATGLPYTTLERDMHLSHFAIHVSPVYYLLLPFYMVFPYPETLSVLQALILATSVIPLWKLAKKHGFTDLCAALFCAVLLIYPAFFGGTVSGLHENFFLTPFILWLFYAIDSKNTPLTALFCVLTLTVKEDAAVYVAVIALWLTVRSFVRKDAPDRRRNIIIGGIMFALSLAWFFAVTYYLSNFGLGVMTDRYDNLIYDGSGSLFTVVKAVIMSPMKVLYECADAEKFNYIILTLMPLCGLPLLCRKFENFILFIPYALVNLFSNYLYQYDIFWQYSFGSLACMFYASILNLGDLSVWVSQKLSPDNNMNPPVKHAFSQYSLIAALVVTAVCFSAVMPIKSISEWSYASDNQADTRAIREIIENIPDDASVAAASLFTVALAEHTTLYDLCYTTPEHLLSCDYIVTDNDDDMRYLYGFKDKSISYSALAALIEENGYTAVEKYKNKLTLYKKNG